MWMLFGIGAILCGLCNVILAFRHKETKWARFCSLALTALTVCAFYHVSAQDALESDWSALVDVMPTVSNMLWLCVTGSIVVNGSTLFAKQ